MKFLAVLLNAAAVVISLAAAVLSVPKAILVKIYPIWLVILVIDFAVTYTDDWLLRRWEFYVLTFIFPTIFLFIDDILMAVSKAILKFTSKKLLHIPDEDAAQAKEYIQK